MIALYQLPLEENRDRPLDALIAQVGDLVLQDEDHPFKILARLPVKTYISATPDNLLETALRRNGREPLVMYSRWRKPLEDTETIEASGKLLSLSVEQPLVYHLFGKIGLPKLLRLSEDDYFEYLMWVNNPAARIRLPDPVITSWRRGRPALPGFPARGPEFPCSISQYPVWRPPSLHPGLSFGGRPAPARIGVP